MSSAMMFTGNVQNWSLKDESFLVIFANTRMSAEY